MELELSYCHKALANVRRRLSNRKKPGDEVIYCLGLHGRRLEYLLAVKTA